MVATMACSQSDAGISTAVKSKLAADTTVKAYQINVDTSEGVVTLTGTVETPAAKDQAIMLARQTDGVRDVVDAITVNRETAPTAGDLGSSARSTVEEAGRDLKDAASAGTEVAKDAAVTAAVKSKFLADTAVSGLKIDVDTANGVVTLNGMVGSRQESERAEMIARKTDGVVSVSNHLKVGH
jgi:osmotically-inducible protein OsmY